MNKAQPLLHPTLKTALVSLDLELKSELARYKSQKQVSCEQSNNFQETSALTVTIAESSSTQTGELNQPPVSLFSQEERQEEEPIPVSVRILPDKKPFLEIFLTPWGILAFILFFLGNAIIFVNWGVEPEYNPTSNPQPTTSPEAVSEQKISSHEQQLSSHQATETKKQQLSQQAAAEKSILPSLTELAITATNSPSQPSVPPPSNRLINLNSNPTAGATVNPQSSPYPDLITALVANIAQQVQNTPKTLGNSAPEANIVPPPPPVIRQTPANPAPEANIAPPPPPVIKQTSANPVPKPTVAPPPPPVIKQTSANPTPKPTVTPSPPPVTNPNSKPNQSQSSSSESATNHLEYSVVSDYANPESLTKIQAIVPDAFITNLGQEIKIKIATFSHESEANQLLQNLQQKGITADIYTSELDDK